MLLKILTIFIFCSALGAPQLWSFDPEVNSLINELKRISKKAISEDQKFYSWNTIQAVNEMVGRNGPVANSGGVNFFGLGTYVAETATGSAQYCRGGSGNLCSISLAGEGVEYLDLTTKEAREIIRKLIKDHKMEHQQIAAALSFPVVKFDDSAGWWVINRNPGNKFKFRTYSSTSSIEESIINIWKTFERIEKEGLGQSDNDSLKRAINFFKNDIEEKAKVPNSFTELLKFPEIGLFITFSDGLKSKILNQNNLNPLWKVSLGKQLTPNEIAQVFNELLDKPDTKFELFSKAISLSDWKTYCNTLDFSDTELTKIIKRVHSEGTPDLLEELLRAGQSKAQNLRARIHFAAIVAKALGGGEKCALAKTQLAIIFKFKK